MSPRTRTVWLIGHRWIGLLLGLLIGLIGLSGSIIVFEQTLDTALNPGLHRVDPGEELLPFADLAAVATAAHPDKNLLFLLREDDNPETSAYAMMAPRGGARTQVFLNPYTGQVLGSRPEQTWLVAVHLFHGELLAGPVGEAVVGGIALILVFSLIGGLVLWWPSIGGWKRALTVKAGSNTPRLLRDLHNVFGAYGFIVLFICSLTALPLIWPEPTKAVLSVMLGDPPMAQRPRTSTPSEDGSRITLGEATEVGRATVPGQWVNLALQAFGPRGFYMIRLLPPGQTSMATSTTVFVDQYSGAVLDRSVPTRQHIVDALASDFSGTIHNGSILGLPGRWLVFIAGFAFPVLFITGFWLWARRKRNADTGGDLSGEPAE